MAEVVGSHDLLLVTLDTLRHDVAVELAAAGRIPNLARQLPGGVWEKRHARRRGSCGSPRWGWPTRTRWVRRCSPRGAGRDGRVRAEVSGPWT
ncbi:hypothetical protein SMICM17S_10753 [Streptomyces microflavus]